MGALSSTWRPRTSALSATARSTAPDVSVAAPYELARTKSTPSPLRYRIHAPHQVCGSGMSIVAYDEETHAFMPALHEIRPHRAAYSAVEAQTHRCRGMQVAVHAEMLCLR